MEADGFSGGIWIMWDREDIKVEVIVKNEQFIHSRIGVNDEFLLFTAVYASPSEQKRRELWEMLQGMVADIIEPWLIAGDFNDIRSPYEQKGGGRVNESRCARFNDWIQRSDLVEVEAKGPFFTWKGPQWEGLDRVYKKLDRCLCNVRWLEKFENAEARILPRLHSDHHPIFVNLCEEVQDRRARCFRFQVMWQLHERFNEVLKESWVDGEEVHTNLEKLKQNLMVWNKEVFGQIEGRKRRLLDRLNGIQCSLERRNNQYLIRLEVWPKVVNNICWEVGNGEKLRFWHDKWLEGGRTLNEMSLGILSEADNSVKVAEMVDIDGRWCLDRFADNLNGEGQNLVLAVLPPTNQMGEDIVSQASPYHGKLHGFRLIRIRGMT
ncbi:hypothetical protein K1719_002147 [Acacia pycnantha]|nr:hypothetical protein K1719_002147 [Acacia pycnantha]